jgi:hypothetical protein
MEQTISSFFFLEKKQKFKAGRFLPASQHFLRKCRSPLDRIAFSQILRATSENVFFKVPDFSFLAPEEQAITCTITPLKKSSSGANYNQIETAFRRLS